MLCGFLWMSVKKSWRSVRTCNTYIVPEEYPALSKRQKFKHKYLEIPTACKVQRGSLSPQPQFCKDARLTSTSLHVLAAVTRVFNQFCQSENVAFFSQMTLIPNKKIYHDILPFRLLMSGCLVLKLNKFDPF